MVENRPAATLLSHLVLVLGVLIIALPVYITFVASTQTAEAIVQNVPMSLVPGGNMLESYRLALFGGVSGYGTKIEPVWPMMWVSLVSALVIAIGKIIISLLSAFAIVYFRFPLRGLVFWAIFITLMLPVEVRILPTYKVVSDLGLLNSYAGLTVPLIASATATFLFRQFFLTVPDELIEAARAGGHSDATLVRQGAGGFRKMICAPGARMNQPLALNTHTSAPKQNRKWHPSNSKTSSSATAQAPRPIR